MFYAEFHNSGICIQVGVGVLGDDDWWHLSVRVLTEGYHENIGNISNSKFFACFKCDGLDGLGAAARAVLPPVIEDLRDIDSEYARAHKKMKDTDLRRHVRGL